MKMNFDFSVAVAEEIALEGLEGGYKSNCVF